MAILSPITFSEPPLNTAQTAINHLTLAVRVEARRDRSCQCNYSGYWGVIYSRAQPPAHSRIYYPQPFNTLSLICKTLIPMYLQGVHGDMPRNQSCVCSISPLAGWWGLCRQQGGSLQGPGVKGSAANADEQVIVLGFLPQTCPLI